MNKSNLIHAINNSYTIKINLKNASFLKLDFPLKRDDTDVIWSESEILNDNNDDYNV